MLASSTPNTTEPQRHTDAEVESLKRQWRQDPCWDLDTTAGFEAHRDELAAYEAAYWTEARRALKQQEQAERQAQPAVKVLSCVQVYDVFDSKRRVVWINAAAISYFTEYPTVLNGEPGPRWTAVYLINGERLVIDASPEQFAGWLRGDQPRPQRHWDFVDEDGGLHCNCGRGVVAP